MHLREIFIFFLPEQKMSAVVDSPVAHDLGQSLLRAAAEDDRAKVENLLLRGIPVDVIDEPWHSQ